MSSSIAFPVISASPKAKTAIDNKKAVLPAIAKGDAAAGKFKSEDARCLECHNSDEKNQGQGFSNGPEGKFAKLAGQYPEYLVKQIKDFRTGERKHDFMSMMANSIDDADLADIAAYFASVKKMQGDGAGDSQFAKSLFLNGDAARNIVPCVSCHGEGGKGISSGNVSYPVIGGQGRLYLEKQILDWRSGERHNDAAGVMNVTTKSLTDAEVQALAKYISGL